MSSRMFQSTILQLKDAMRGREIGVMDASGVVVACSFLRRMGEVREEVASELVYTSEALQHQGYTYKPFDNKGARLEYAVFVQGEDEEAQTYCNILAISLNGIKQFYDDKYDRATFIKDIILDNILPGDIYVKSKELHFGQNVNRVIMAVRADEKTENGLLEIVASIFPDQQNDFVINVDECNVAVVKEIKGTADYRELEKIAKTVEETIASELLIKTLIGIGTQVKSLKDLAKSYKEAQVAIEVGKVFDTDKSIIHYENLGIGRLIYQLPTTLCEMFLSEVFKQGALESLDQETLLTIQKFFENNLNVSETSRKLFVHRNTLVYRLEKIKKLTGLELREFDHAIVFKVALMVKRYLASRELL